MSSRNGGERVALVFDETEYTYAQLDELAGGLAATLAERGVRAGDRVALMSSNRPELVMAVQAIWRLGAAVVLFSPAWKQAETQHALAITAPAQAVGDHPVLAGLMPMLHLDEPITPAPGTQEPANEPPNEPDPEAEAVLVFSSGTTGLPKAVRHTNRSLRAAIGHWRDALELTGADRIQVATPPSHILGLLNIATALELGIWMRLHRRFDLDRVLRHIEADRITVEMAVAPIALALANHPKLEDYDLSSLRFIMWGATPVTPSVAETVTRRTGVPWVPAYGASELPVIACNPVRGARLDSAGKPVPGVSMRVVSLGTGEPVEPGETGEIQVRADSLMSGYLPAETTAEAFSDGWYRTGDVGYVEPDGWVHLTDRSKEMIKVRGFQVAPAEVEGVLLGHPAVLDCAVFGIPDAVNGESIIAAVTLAPGAQPAEAEPAEPAEAGPAEAGPAEPSEPSEPAEAGPAEAGPAEAGPAEAGPAEAGPAEAGPAEAGPAEAGPAEPAEPAEAGPAEAEPAEARPAEASPAELIAYIADRLASYKKPAEVIVVNEIPRLPSGKALRRLLKEGYGRASVD